MHSRFRMFSALCIGAILLFHREIGAQPTEPSGGFIASLQITTSLGQTVRSGVSLHTGECIAATINVNKEVYLYAINIAPNGHATLLFPFAQDDSASSVIGKLRIPPKGECFRVAKLTGDESLFIIASVRSLFKRNALRFVYRQAKGRDSKSKKLESENENEKRRLSRKAVENLEKELLTLQKRTLIRDKEPCDVAEATNQQNGTATLCFSFHHVQ